MITIKTTIRNLEKDQKTEGHKTIRCFGGYYHIQETKLGFIVWWCLEKQVNAKGNRRMLTKKSRPVDSLNRCMELIGAEINKFTLENVTTIY
tara:strand:- start:1574 stop:1849 length:276 start_codon:yes stop_codon:yes gene_type:complete